MTFDEAAYQSSFLKKHRSSNALPADLLPRYAITLPCTDAEVAARLQAVRALWNKLGGQATTLAKPARMCLAEDERLQAAHGAAMATAAFWQKQQAAGKQAAQSVVTQVAEDLKQSHGPIGVVTSSLVERYAAQLGLDAGAMASAVSQAGLTQVPPADLPDDPGIADYRRLVERLAEGGVPTVTALLHPTVTEYRVLGRWAAATDPKLRLDAVAISTQLAALDKLGKSKTGVAQRDALSMLNRAVKDGADLDRLALYQLAEVAGPTAVLAPRTAARQLADLGVTTKDAAVLAVTLAERSQESAGGNAAKVTRLIASGQLREARVAARELPEGDLRAAAEKEVEQAAARVQELLDAAGRAAASRDEATAVRLIGQARELSREDADEALVAVPQPPPVGLSATPGAADVALRWVAAPGQDESTTYLVLRSDGAPPTAGTPGVVVARTSETTWTDSTPPVSGELHYGVLATSPGRPDGRPATVTTAFLPPVADVGVDVGETDVSLRWNLHPSCESVELRTNPPGSTTTVPAARRGHRATGLAEGVAHTFTLVARYRSRTGAALAAPPTTVSATPRAAARPVTTLRTQPVLESGRTRVRSSWRPADRSEVRLRYAAAAPPWPAGTVVPAAEVERYGRELSGHRSEESGTAVVTADLPPGLHHVVPFSVGGGGTVVGRGTRVGVTEPVRDLKAVRFSGFAKLSWEWPPDVQQAEVQYEADGEVDLFTVSQSEYRSRGAEVPLGRERTVVEVRSLITFGDKSFSSAAVLLVLEGEGQRPVSYSLAPAGPRLLSGRKRRVRFSSDEPGPPVRVAVVWSMADTVPLSAADGTELDVVDVAADPGVPTEVEVELPKHVRRPYWLKCFLVSGPARLVHPPVATLRER